MKENLIKKFKMKMRTKTNSDNNTGVDEKQLFPFRLVWNS